jgi:hypothetical protein
VADPGFADVPAGHRFAGAIWWLAAQGATQGYEDGTFRPTEPVSRQAAAAMLFRPTTQIIPSPEFTDVPPDHRFGPAIGWLAAEGLTEGYDDGTFRPTAPVSRQAIAALLYRQHLVELVEPPTAHRCETLGPSECLLPFPSDHLTVADAEVDRAIGSSGTGLRLDLDPASMPTNGEGVAADPTQINANDGFSPGQAIIVQVPGVDLEGSGAAPITDPARSLDAGSPVVVLDADTGQRVPHFVEWDTGVAGPERPIIVRPVRNYEEGHRHVVALRRLVDDAGDPLPAGDLFAAYRDRTTTPIPAVEARRAEMEATFADLEAAGIVRDELQLAWDFTVASEQNLSERALHLRDEAFADLGDEAPTFTVTQVDDDPNVHLQRRVRGTFEVPRYLDGDGGPGSTLAYGPDGLPEPQGTQVADFDCIVPVGASAAEPARVSLFGHGLLGNASGVMGFSGVAEDHRTVFCGTSWIGMSSADLPVVAGILVDFSGFATIPDRAQQGFLNFLYLGRLLVHDDGFAADPNFQDAGTSLLDRDELVYVGGSQGGIMGGALTALAQDFTDAVLAVPGMNYSTMLRRSSNWDTYDSIMKVGYADPLDRTLLLSLSQILWDRGEANGYAHHITDDPYPGTPAHRVLLFEAFADHQVANVATETMARTMGVRARRPVLAPGRSPVLDPYWGLEAAVPGDTGSVVVMWDWGTPAPPTTNEAPTEGDDPHGNVGDPDETVAQEMLLRFLRDDVFVDLCGAGPCTSP